MPNEKRLVDANHLSERVNNSNDTPVQKLYVDALLAGEPTVDAVEVVRCKDCAKYYHVIGRDDREVWGCRYFGAMTKADDFCSYGERRTDNG